MLSMFRLLSIIEGLSLILLLFVAMPLKYYADMPIVVTYVGMGHGVLFLAYIGLSLPVSHQQKWSVLLWSASLAASMIPFACFILEKYLKAHENKQAESSSSELPH